ncbi:MAG TPA: glycosyltransferase, partial [Candidatus Methylomirabilis sp.]|nr:glycosyltransferase [Candidatus Methylomirabilis sp.]
MGPPRVLHIITRLWRGGAPNTTLDLVRGLEGDGFSQTLVTGLADDPAWDLLGTGATAGLRVVTVPALTREVRPLADLRALLELTRLLRREAPDLIHVHTSKAGFLGRLAARFAGVRPVIYSPHGSILAGYFSPGTTRVFAWLDARVARFTDRIVCCTSQEIAEYLAAGIGRPDQYVVIPNGVDAEAYALRAAPPEET